MAESDEASELTAEFQRLAAAAQAWIRRTFPDPPIGHGGPECQWCPICQFVNLLRGEHPEVAARVADAGAAVADAVKALVEAAVARVPTGEAPPRPDPGEPGPASGGPRPRVEHIDLGHRDEPDA